MELLYFLIWLVVGLSAAFALIWLGLLFSSIKKAIDTLVQEVVPVINEIEETLKGVNEEIERVEKVFEKLDRISSSLQGISKKVEVAIQPGLGRLVTLYEAAKKALGVVFKNK
jgi:predicted PurR-regulated permease PerM